MALTLSGRVLTEQGQPLPGVSVRVKETGALSATNASGQFLLQLDAAEVVLVLTCASYRPQTVAARAGEPLTITLYRVTSSAAASPAAAAEPLVVADELPAFPGGGAAYRAYLLKNSHYPEQAKGAAGSVYVSFEVDEQGRILNAEVQKSTLSVFEPEVLRLVRLMPWWTPGRRAGQPVRVSCTLRIKFGFQAEP